MKENNSEFIDYYDLLKISYDADNYQVMEAYRNAARRLSVTSDGYSIINRIEKELELYKTALNILTNPAEKEKYDLELRLYKLKKEEQEVEKKLKARLYSKLSGNHKPVKNSVFTFSKIKFNPEMKEKVKTPSFTKKELAYKFDSGKKLLQQGKTDLAIKLFRELVDNYPKCAEYRSYLGLALMEKGWEGYAQAEFKVALHYQPNDPIALRYHKGNIVNMEKRFGTSNEQHSEKLAEKIKKISSWFKLRTQNQNI